MRENITTQADINLYEAIKECKEFVKNWKINVSSVVELLRLIRNRLGFVFYMLYDEAPVYTVFEVLNSRGLDVDSLDKCKSMLMGIAFEKCGAARDRHINELHENWKKIYQYMGIKMVPGHEILRFVATLKSKNKPSETLGAEDSLGLLRQICEEDPNQVINISTMLLDVAEKLKDLYEDPRREAVTKIAHARLLATSILLANTLSEQEKSNLLCLWEKITFRIFGMFRKDARTKRGDFTRLAWEVFNDELSAQNTVTRLKEIGAEYPVKEAINELDKSRDCYEEWQEELRYFLFRYEEYLAKQEGSNIDTAIWEKIWIESASSTVEHIHPQEPDKSWKGKLGRGGGGHLLQNNVNRLGNLLLLPPGWQNLKD